MIHGRRLVERQAEHPALLGHCLIEKQVVPMQPHRDTEAAFARPTPVT